MTRETGKWLDDAGPLSRAIRCGIGRTPEAEHAEPIFTSSSFLFDSPEDAAAKFAGEADGKVYCRYTKPTVRAFGERLAALEQGESAVGTASGMSAILALCLTHLKTGDHVLCARDVFGATLGLLQDTLQKFGVEVSFMPLTEPDQWRGAGKPETRVLCICAPSNPLNAVADTAALAQLSRDMGAILAVDICFCSPALQMPLLLGAGIVTHSDTKYPDGQGRVLGGALVGAEELIAPVVAINRSRGPAMSAFNAQVMLKGLETLDLRMRAHLETAQKLAEQSSLEAVHYCGLPDHPGHALASCQQHGFGGVLAFEVAGGREAAWQFINGTQLMSLNANLGDAKSQWLLRIALGLEDLQSDCLRGFAAMSRQAATGIFQRLHLALTSKLAPHVWPD